DPSDFDYDFLGDAKLKAIELVETFYDKIRPVVNFIRENFDWISTIVLGIGTAMLAWKIATGVQAVVKTLAGMTDAGQITLGIALMLGGITLGASGFSEIFSGEGTLGSWLKAGIGSALGIGGALITFGTGVGGWTVGIGLVLAMVITGVTLGYKQGMENIIEGVMQGNGGVLITELASAFSQKLSEITITLDPLIVGSEKVRGFASEAESYKTEMVNIFTAIQLAVDDSAEAFENLNTAMQDFTTATQNMADEAYINVISAISGAIAGAAGDAKVEWEGLLETIYLVKAEGDSARADRLKRLSELQTAWAEGTISQENFKKATLEIYEEIAAGERAVLDASISFDDLLISMKKIDWQDEADRSKAFEDIGGSVQSAREKVNEALNGLTEDFYVILADVKDPQ
ncbi:MAG TPA: hypothetical protein VFF56_03095, partial [Bacillota bacterium]|nr:hypothetical protein [Bacillota bacterium]